MYLLGYELGPESIRIILLRADDRVLVRQHTQQVPATDKATGAPHGLWWHAVCQATQDLLEAAAVAPDAVGGIGIGDTQERQVGSAGAGLFPHKDLTPRGGKAMSPGDYHYHRLTGSRQTTGPTAPEATHGDSHPGIPTAGQPAVGIPGWGYGLIGRLTAEAGRDTGLVPGIPVGYGAGPVPGLSLIRGRSLSAGTVTIGGEPSAVCFPSAEHRWEKGRQRAGAATGLSSDTGHRTLVLVRSLAGLDGLHRWVRAQLLGDAGGRTDWERLAAAVPIGSEGLHIFPPEGQADSAHPGQPTTEAAMVGIMAGRHTQAHIYRALQEGMAFSVAMGIMELKTGDFRPVRVRVVAPGVYGAGIFCMTLANLTDLPVEVWDEDGAAGTGSEWSGDVRDTTADRVQPRAEYRADTSRDAVMRAYRSWIGGRPGDGRPENFPPEKSDREKPEPASPFRGTPSPAQWKAVADMLSAWTGSLPHPAWEAARQAIDVWLRGRDDLAAGTGPIAGEVRGAGDELFLQHLAQAAPGLSLQEVRVCQLLWKKFSTKEMAAQLSLSLRGVETVRYRLRRKLGLPAGYSLRKFLDEVAQGRVAAAGASDRTP